MSTGSTRFGGVRRGAGARGGVVGVAVERLEGRRLLSAVTYDAAGDFSYTANPNGVWSYGDIPTAGAAFVPYPTVGPLAIIDQVTAWYSTAGNAQLYVGKATNGGAVDEGPVVLPAGLLDVHPGQNGEQSDVRFTAPVAGTVQIGAAFIGVDTDGTTTDVHVLHNGTSLADGLVNGYGSAFSPTIPTVVVAKGDTIEFTVGYGSNGTYTSDSTSLAATVTLTPVTGTSTLVPAVTRSTVAATAVAGGVDKGTVQGTLTAAAATKGRVTVAAYATADGVPGDGSLLGSLVIGRLNLKAGKASRFVVPVRALPAGLAAGQYAVVVQVTDPAGDVATTTAGSLFVATPVVVLSSSTLSDARPSPVRAGHPVLAVLTLDDTGNVDVDGTLTITYALASAPTSASDVAPPRTITRAVRIAHGRTFRVPLSFTVPVGTAAGAAYLAADLSLTDKAVGTAAVSLATADPFTVL